MSMLPRAKRLDHAASQEGNCGPNRIIRCQGRREIRPCGGASKYGGGAIALDMFSSLVVTKVLAYCLSPGYRRHHGAKHVYRRLRAEDGL